jgi:hypothetical protein
VVGCLSDSKKNASHSTIRTPFYGAWSRDLSSRSLHGILEGLIVSPLSLASWRWRRHTDRLRNSYGMHTGASPSRLCSLRGFATPDTGLNQRWRPLPSWSSGPLRVSPLRRPVACATDPLVSFVAVLSLGLASALRPETALQGLDRRRIGWSLARLPPFLAFCT